MRPQPKGGDNSRIAKGYFILFVRATTAAHILKNPPTHTQTHKKKTRQKKQFFETFCFVTKKHNPKSNPPGKTRLCGQSAPAPAKHGASTAEAPFLAEKASEGVGEHDEEVADREVDLTDRTRDNMLETTCKKRRGRTAPAVLYARGVYLYAVSVSLFQLPPPPQS